MENISKNTGLLNLDYLTHFENFIKQGKITDEIEFQKLVTDMNEISNTSPSETIALQNSMLYYCALNGNILGVKNSGKTLILIGFHYLYNMDILLTNNFGGLKFTVYNKYVYEVVKEFESRENYKVISENDLISLKDDMEYNFLHELFLIIQKEFKEKLTDYCKPDEILLEEN